MSNMHEGPEPTTKSTVERMADLNIVTNRLDALVNRLNQAEGRIRELDVLLRFQTQAASITTAAGTTSPSFGDLTGSTGPSVTVAIGPSKRAVVVLTAAISAPALETAVMSFDGGGLLSTNGRSLKWAQGSGSTATRANPRMSAAILAEGLSTGNQTFTAKYKASLGSTAIFADRTIMVTPIG